MSADVRHRFVFFGTPLFAAKILVDLIAAGYEIPAVVSAPDRRVGRGGRTVSPAVVAEAKRHGLLTLQPESLRNPEIEPMLAALGATAAVLVAYGKMIPPSVLHLFAHGTVNVHPSLLPRHRGPSPIQSAILSGDQVTGVSLMVLDEQVDHGPLLAQVECGVEPDDTAATLTEKLGQLGGKLLVGTLPDYLSGTLIPVPQDHSQATYSRKVAKEEGLVDWLLTPDVLVRRWRAFQPWPGLFTLWRGKVLKFGLLEPLERPPQAAPAGQAFLLPDGRRFGVACSNGAVVPHSVQLQGRTNVPNEAFLRGHRDLIGVTLGSLNRAPDTTLPKPSTSRSTKSLA